MTTFGPRWEDGDPFRHYDAAYVLGALTASDRREFESHLQGCAACTAAVGELAGLPGLLTSVPAEVAESLSDAAEDPPSSLLPGLVRRTHRRRRMVLLATAGIAAAVIAAFVVVLTVTTHHAGPAQASGMPITLQAKAGDVPLSADADLVSVGWGTRIDLKCSYENEPGYTPSVYVMTITDAAGQTEPVASWMALPGKTASLTGSTAIRVADIASLDVRSQAGDVLLRWSP